VCLDAELGLEQTEIALAVAVELRRRQVVVEGEGLTDAGCRFAQ
jgi:hypothetical protein